MLDKIRDILVEYVEIPREEITEESKLMADLGFSSLDVMDVVLAFEEEFKVEIPDRKLLEIVTIEDMIKILEEELG
uniref:acyl carrier protein n=1 Tax=Acetatifactor sp. TaxID=1872090 RepID=UPI00405650F5